MGSALNDELAPGSFLRPRETPLRCVYSMGLQDMVWLAGLRPPLDHIHAGRDLRNLLERVRVWLGEVGGRCRKRDEGGKATSTTVPDKDAVSADYSDLLFDDFSKRRDGICRSLGSLLAAALPQSR